MPQKQSLLLLTYWKMCSVTQSCPTLWSPVDCSLWGSSVHGIFQARILECIIFWIGSLRIWIMLCESFMLQCVLCLSSDSPYTYSQIYIGPAAPLLFLRLCFPYSYHHCCFLETLCWHLLNSFHFCKTHCWGKKKKHIQHISRYSSVIDSADPGRKVPELNLGLPT